MEISIAARAEFLSAPSALECSSNPISIDPLAPDSVADLAFPITSRQLLRLLIVAASTAQRFQEENGNLDPIAWLLSPRHLFEGMTAVAACTARDAFIRAIILHGVRLGLDAHPDDIDALRGEEVDNHTNAVSLTAERSSPDLRVALA